MVSQFVWAKVALAILRHLQRLRYSSVLLAIIYLFFIRRTKDFTHGKGLLTLLL